MDRSCDWRRQRLRKATKEENEALIVEMEAPAPHSAVERD